jgi:hypothetical protein
MATRLILVVCALWFVAVAGMQLLTGNSKYDLNALAIGAAPLIGFVLLRPLAAYVVSGSFR